MVLAIAQPRSSSAVACLTLPSSRFLGLRPSTEARSLTASPLVLVLNTFWLQVQEEIESRDGEVLTWALFSSGDETGETASTRASDNVEAFAL